MGSRKGRTLGRCAREVVVSYHDQASSSPLSSSSPETTTLLQRFLLEGLADLTLLGSVFLLLLLGRQEASSLPSDPIFWNRWPRFLDRRQIL
jgi:hypothetical protein